MSNKTEMIRARVAPELKAKVEPILEALGLTASDAIRLFYVQVALRKGLPFDVAIPNKTTRSAMQDVEQGENLSHFADTGQRPHP